MKVDPSTQSEAIIAAIRRSADPKGVGQGTIAEARGLSLEAFEELRARALDEAHEAKPGTPEPAGPTRWQPSTDGRQLGNVAEMAISRVHVLLVELDGVVYAMDTASRNGVHLNGTKLTRPAPLRHHDLLELPAVRVEWRVVH